MLLDGQTQKCSTCRFYRTIDAADVIAYPLHGQFFPHTVYSARYQRLVLCTNELPLFDACDRWESE